MNSMYDFAFSEQGYNHIKADKVCQDSSGHYSDDLMSVIVVADGHGSDNYPRTDRGSSFAVDATITAIKEFVNAVDTNAIDISTHTEIYLEQLAKSILASWYAAVDYDLEKYPFSEEELAKVSDTYKKRYLSGERQEKAYGSTLIAACQTTNYWFGLQIGDGKCVCIAPDGSMSEPIPWDDDCEANITTSICDADAIDEFRYFFTTECPIATLMGTDGVDDSYANSEELHVLYRSLVAIFAEYGPQIGKSEIKEFLPGLSRKGSGDDVSIAGIVSAELPPIFVEVLKAQSRFINANAEREKAEHELVLAEEKKEYVLSAMKKAKLNYEQCLQKAEEAHAALELARQDREKTIKSFSEAEALLQNALSAYQSFLTCSDISPALDEEPSVESSFPTDTSFAPLEIADAGQEIPAHSESEEFPTGDFEGASAVEQDQDNERL